jgi:hypothetical protein
MNKDYEKELESRLFDKIRALHQLDLETLKTANACMALYFEMKLNSVEDFKNFFATVVNCCDESRLNEVVYNMENKKQ